jgi:hypothetical protein
MDLRPDWDYLTGVAEKRLANNRTSRHVSDYGTEIELIGAAGELVARRFLGLSDKLHDQFDGGVDVKATKLTPKLNFRFLQWPKTKKFKADIILLTAINLRMQQGVAVGWEWVDVVREAPINFDRDYPCHEIPVIELRPVWEFFILPDKKKKK